MEKQRRGRGNTNPGPKPKPPEERRRNRVMLNLTDDEYQRLLTVAGSTPPSNYVRQILLRHLRQKR
jgi:hypothetical protein